MKKIDNASDYKVHFAYTSGRVAVGRLKGIRLRQLINGTLKDEPIKWIQIEEENSVINLDNVTCYIYEEIEEDK